MSTQYASVVYAASDTRPNMFNIRSVSPTLEHAKSILDAEVERRKQPPLEWREDFDGALATQNGLVYDIRPVYTYTLEGTFVA